MNIFMNKFKILATICFVGLVAISATSQAKAQAGVNPVNEAKARLACGSGTVVNAQYLPGGVLQVTCQQTTTEQSLVQNALPEELLGTTLTPTVAAALVTTVVFLAIIAGDDSTGTTATTFAAPPSRGGE